MMDVRFLLLCIALSKHVFGIVVQIKGDHVAKRHGRFSFNCTSDTVPVGLEAEIKVDQVSYSIISLHNKCFSTELQRFCLPDICQCSNTGLWFSHSLRAINPEGLLDVTCLMVFGSKGKFSDSMQVRIIDFVGPEVTADEEFPVSAGKLVKFTCRITRTSLYISNATFEWKCLNNETVQYKTGNSAIFATEITRKIDFKHHNQTCACIVDIHGYIATGHVQITVRRLPGIHLLDTALCNSTDKINISCIIFTEESKYGFGTWIHSYRGTYLRSLKGQIHDKESMLVIESCTYEDKGDYMCVVWNEYDGNTFYKNSTFSLNVNCPPVIVSGKVIRDQATTLAVLFCSASDTTQFWSKQNQQIVNSTHTKQTQRKTTVKAIVFNQIIDCDGYSSNLSLPNRTTGIYELILHNDFGETRQTFNVELIEDIHEIENGNRECVKATTTRPIGQTTAEGHQLVFNVKHTVFTLEDGFSDTYDFRFVVFGLIAIGIFIVTSTGTVITLRSRCSSNVVIIVGPHERSTVPIYHSAPASEPVVRIYDIINSEYLEVIDNDRGQSHVSDNDKESEENDESPANSTHNMHEYEEME